MPKQRSWDTARMNVHGVLKLKALIIRKLKRRQWGKDEESEHERKCTRGGRLEYIYYRIDRKKRTVLRACQARS